MASPRSPRDLPELKIVHELSLDPEAFSERYHVSLAEPGTNSKLSQNGERSVQLSMGNASGIEKAIKDQMYRAMFDVVASQRESDPAAWATAMTNLLVEMRDSIIAVVPRSDTHIKEELKEKIDGELVHQMLSTQSLDAEGVLGLFSYACSVIMSVEAPSRRQESRDWIDGLEQKTHLPHVQVQELIPDLFRFVNDKIEQIEADSVRAQIDALRQIAKVHGAQYERDHLPLTNPIRTYQWLCAVLSHEHNPALQILRHPIPVIAPLLERMAVLASGGEGQEQLIVTSEMAQQCVIIGVLKTISQATANPLIPETLMLDKDRINKFQNMFQHHVILGILLSLAHTLDKSVTPTNPQSSSTKEWLTSLHSDFSDLLVSPDMKMSLLREQLKSCLVARVAEKGGEGGPGQGEGQGEGAQGQGDRVSAMVETFDRACDPSHMLFSTVQVRVLRFLYAVLTQDVQSCESALNGDQVPITYLAPHCLKMGASLGRMVTHNLKAFSDVYGVMIRKLVTPSSSSSPRPIITHQAQSESRPE